MLDFEYSNEFRAIFFTIQAHFARRTNLNEILRRTYVSFDPDMLFLNENVSSIYM